MSIINNAKEIADLVKKLGDIELYRRIVELEGEIIDLTREKRDAEAELETVKATLKIKGSMVYRKPYYYLDDDQVPYCPKCWEVDNVAVHLVGPTQTHNGVRYDCRNCNSMFF